MNYLYFNIPPFTDEERKEVLKYYAPLAEKYKKLRSEMRPIEEQLDSLDRLIKGDILQQEQMKMTVIETETHL